MEAKLKEILVGPSKAISQSLITLIEAVEQLQGHADEFAEDELYQQFEDISELFAEAKDYINEILKEMD